jgi:hypothetical protein
MRIGDITGAVPQDILDLGFTFATKIKLLGFTLQNYGDITAANYEGVVSKIDNLIRFSDRFSSLFRAELRFIKLCLFHK